MKEAIQKDPVVAEKPKAAKTKEATGEVAEAKVAGEKKVRVPRVAKSAKFRLIPGVDPATFRGQRQIVVKALQSLGEGFFTPEEVAAKCEGLVSKTPVLASATYHLKALVTDGKLEIQETVAPVAETAAPAAEQAAA